MATNKTTIYTKMATSVANSKGIDLNTAINISGNNALVSMLNENMHPSKNSIASKIKLITQARGNVSNPEMFVESYVLRPVFTGLIECSGPQKNIWYLPLNSTYAIKFYYPDEYDAEYYNYVYAVPAKIDKTYLTGLKDYTTGVAQSWINAFVQYASSLPSNIIPKTSSSTPRVNATKNFSASESIQKQRFSFNFYGALTGTISNANTFSFEYNFYPGATPTNPTVVGTSIASTITR